ncbi:cytochrome P450 [Sphaerisporangium sp. NPDC051011]|uniref:cytochrome P450 n=1 Tax=Sphaerisporangium sp. NPDC051011 TaxID=3155792 RepID=UPI0033E154BD
MSDKKCPLDFDYHGPELDDIFDTYRELRATCPVGYSEKHGGFWFLTKNDDIFAAEQDHTTFSVAPSMLLPNFGTDVPLIPIDIDPPAHSKYRRILLPLFTPAAIDALTPRVVDVAQELAKGIDVDSVVDASAAYARPLPTIIFSALAGFPEEDWPRFDRWVDEIIYERTVSPDIASAAADEVFAYFDDLLTRRRSEEPRDDIIGHLLSAEVDGRPLTNDELLSYCYLLFLAGLDTTAWAIRSGLWYLARNAEAQKQLRDDLDAVPAAVEEFLRTLSPVQAMARTATRDVEIKGQRIKAGERVVLAFGSGNRDEEQYERADEIILDRQQNRHFAFGVGIHRCLGSNLGRREVLVALQEFLRLLPPFTLADPEQPWHGVGPLNLKFSRKDG